MLHQRAGYSTILFSLSTMVALSASAGCGSTRSVRVQPTEFLGDLTDLRVVDAQTSGQVHLRERGVLGRYRQFILDPVLIYFHAGSSASAVNPVELAKLTESLRRKVADELTAGGYEVVEAAGPGVLRIRAALTHVDPSRPAANVAAKATGIATGIGGFLVPSIDLGGAGIEAEMLDSATGERIAAFLDARKGRRFRGTLAAARTWGHAEAAFGEWAEELRARLDALRRED